jgi:prolyl oligopeptidase
MHMPGRTASRPDAVLPAAILAVLVAAGACERGSTSAPTGPEPAAPATSTGAPATASRLAYPAARRADTVDEYHGTAVADPYRWLEELDSEETRAWIEAENRVTAGVLDAIPERKAIADHLTARWNFERWSIPIVRGKRWFFSKNDGLQNQNVWWWTDDPEGEPRLLLDPNLLSADGTIAVSGFEPSHDGRRVAYALSQAGSDWKEWRIRDVASGEDLSDRLEWSKFTGASWTRDDAGFFYGRFDAPEKGRELDAVNQFQKLYYHRVGTPQSADELIYERKDHGDWEFSGEVTDDGRYLVITVDVGTDRRNMVFYKDLRARRSAVVELIPELESSYGFIDNQGPVFWFHTDAGAPRGRVIAIDVRRPRKDRWKEIVPEHPDGTLEGVDVVGGRFFARYLEHASSRVRSYRLDGKPDRDVALRGIGTASGFSGRRDERHTFYSYTDFTQPTTIYRYDTKAGTAEVFAMPNVGFDPDAYEIRQYFFPSKDGTPMALFVAHRKGIQLDGRNPTYLYGYGGFNVSLTPSFSVVDLTWMDMGGVFAQATLRGGGEYGETWHEAGTKERKQNVFDDFIRAAEFLIERKYTSPDRLAIGGRSNGGLLVGAAMTQRPDLFAAVLAGVGVLDMLRFHKFTIGWAWVSDYGSADDPAHFPALLAYSPYHNLRPGTDYPATLIYTADHDDRVVPAHSYKFAAALQHAHRGEDPVLIRIDTKAGHGAGKPTSKRIEEWADLWGFLVRVLDMKLPPEFGAPTVTATAG